MVKPSVRSLWCGTLFLFVVLSFFVTLSIFTFVGTVRVEEYTNETSIDGIRDLQPILIVSFIFYLICSIIMMGWIIRCCHVAIAETCRGN